MLARSLVSLALLAAATGALAHDFRKGGLIIDHPTVAPTRGALTVTAGYMTILNRGREADRLVAVTSPQAERVEIHTHERVGEMMRMRPVQGGVAVPAGGRVEFRPGGLHLMLYGVKGRIAEGEAVDVTLTFERAGPVEVVAMVETPNVAGGRSHHH